MSLAAGVQDGSAAQGAAAGLAQCIHCGTRFKLRSPGDEFCCAGCEYVYRMIGDEGFEQYYELRDKSISPVQSVVFQERDFHWFADRVARAEQDASGASVQAAVDIQGISCLGCIWLIEKVILRIRGVTRVDIDANAGILRISWQKAGAAILDVPGELQRFGYVVGPLTRHNKPESRALLGRLGICGAFALNAMLFSLPGYLGMESSFALAPHFKWLTFFFATFSFAAGGSYFIKRAVLALQRRAMHIDLPIALGIVLAYAGSLLGMLISYEGLFYFDFVAIFVFLMLGGRWLQVVALEGNRNRILGGSDIARTVTRHPDNTEITLEELRAGDAYLLGRGRFVPVASRMTEDRATFSLESINGEAEPRTSSKGADVPAGAIHLGRETIVMEALEAWPDSLLKKLVDAPAASANRAAKWVERLLRNYILVILLLAFVGMVAWLYLDGFVSALQVGISILVVSCPCALGVAIPLLDELSVASLRRAGVYLREGAWWSRMPGLRNIIFDKTGTLTDATPTLLNKDALDALDDAQRTRLLTLVEYNRHPSARSLREHLLDISAENFPVKEEAGQGVLLETPGGTWSLGRPGWLAREGAEQGDGESSGSANECEFRHGGRLLAHFSFRDALREDATESIQALRGHGLNIGILSGDRPEKVARVAQALGLDAALCAGGMHPAEKAEWLRANDAGRTLYVGDGINDSLAFDTASCRGTPVIDQGVLENKADFYYTGRGLSGICELWRTSLMRRKAMQGVFGFTVAYNIAAVAICLAGKMNPLLAAILMPLSSLISLSLVGYAGRRMKSA